MNRDQYFKRFSNTNLQKQELERKWRLFMEEQNMQNMIMEAANRGGQSSAVASAGGGGFPKWEVATDTAYLYPIADLLAAISVTLIQFSKEGNKYIFNSLSDLDLFYYDVWYKTSLSQPIGNLGYSMGVGTNLLGSYDEIHLDLNDGTRIITWQLMTQTSDQSENAPQWQGNSPKGTIGYGTIYSDVNGDGIPELVTDPSTGNNLDPLRFVRVN